MIIKKKFAQHVLDSVGHADHLQGGAHHQVVEDINTIPEEPLDPYADMALSDDDFATGRLSDRREGPRNDRRMGYRRFEDREVISLAHEEANAIREAAAEEGFQQGLMQAQQTMQELREAIDALMRAREETIESVSRELGEMAIEIAGHILKTEVACDEGLVMSVVRDTLGRVDRDQKSIFIKVNPVDLALVKDAMAEDTGLSKTVEVMVSQDAQVDQGSCIVESRAGQIDARFATQLTTLRELLRLKGTD